MRENVLEGFFDIFINVVHLSDLNFIGLNVACACSCCLVCSPVVFVIPLKNVLTI